MKKYTLISLVISSVMVASANAGLESLSAVGGTPATTNVLAAEYVQIVGYAANTDFYGSSNLEISYDSGVSYLKVSYLEGELGGIYQGPCILRLRCTGSSANKARVQFVRGLASAFAMHKPESPQLMAKLQPQGNLGLLVEK